MCRHFVLLKDDYNRFSFLPGFEPSVFFDMDVKAGMDCYGLAMKDGVLSLEKKKFGMSLPSGFVYNARSENVALKKTVFADFFKTDRIVVPCSGFFEEDRHGKEHYFLPEDELLYMCGLYQEGNLVLLTRPADETVSFFHKRMPLLIHRKDIPLYLDLRNGTFLFDMLEKPVVKNPETSDQLSLF